MGQTVEAVFDGTVFRPEKPVKLKPNTHVRITIETSPPGIGKTSSFLKTARGLNLEGPPDWSENLDKYLYGTEPPHEE